MPASQPVPFVALERQHAPLRESFADALDRLVSSSGYILGEEVDRFEAEFATYCGVAHCVGVASGTAALMLALLGAGVRNQATRSSFRATPSSPPPSPSSMRVRHRCSVMSSPARG